MIGYIIGYFLPNFVGLNSGFDVHVAGSGRRTDNTDRTGAEQRHGLYFWDAILFLIHNVVLQLKSLNNLTLCVVAYAVLDNNELSVLNAFLAHDTISRIVDAGSLLLVIEDEA